MGGGWRVLGSGEEQKKNLGPLKRRHTREIEHAELAEIQRLEQRGGNLLADGCAADVQMHYLLAARLFFADSAKLNVSSTLKIALCNEQKEKKRRFGDSAN